MEYIEVNDYVRTKNGYIAKLININKQLGFLEFDKPIYAEKYKPSCIIDFSKFNKRYSKHSKDIIDLIEVGDLVEVFVEEHFENGEKIEDTYVYEVTATNVIDFKGNRLNEIGVAGECGPELIPFENVKGIATREAFKRIEYEV